MAPTATVSDPRAFLMTTTTICPDMLTPRARREGGCRAMARAVADTAAPRPTAARSWPRFVCRVALDAAFPAARRVRFRSAKWPRHCSGAIAACRSWAAVPGTRALATTRRRRLLDETMRACSSCPHLAATGSRSQYTNLSTADDVRVVTDGAACAAWTWWTARSRGGFLVDVTQTPRCMVARRLTLRFATNAARNIVDA